MIINYSDQNVIKGKKSIFLAGPTPRKGDVLSWRKEACDILFKIGFDGVVYVPEFSDNSEKEDYTDQAMWERDALIDSTVIIFWIPRDLKDLPAFTTNVEFGYYIHTGKIIYGRPDNTPKTKYLDWLYEVDYGKIPYNNLKDLLENAVNLSNDLYALDEQFIYPVSERKLIGRKR